MTDEPVPVEQREQAIFDFLCRKYVQRSSPRQAAMGLQYTEAETHDLAREIARFERDHLATPAPDERLREALDLLRELDRLREGCSDDELGAIAGRSIAAFVKRYRAALGGEP